MLRWPVEADEKDKVVIKDNLHNKSDDNRLDFTKSLNKRESNVYDLTLFKKNAKKVFFRAEMPVESPSTARNNTSGKDTSLHILDSGNEELVNIFQSFELEKTPEKAAKMINGRLEGFFAISLCLIRKLKILTETEIGVLEKGLGFATTPSKVNESDHSVDFNDFARKMMCKLSFRNELTENCSEPFALNVKSNWIPPYGHSTIEIFVSKLEKEVFSVLPGTRLDYNLSTEEWLAVKGLVEDQNIITKNTITRISLPADKSFCVVVCDRVIIL